MPVIDVCQVCHQCSSVYAAWLLSGVLQHLHGDFKQCVTQRQQESLRYRIVSARGRHPGGAVPVCVATVTRCCFDCYNE